MEAQKKPLIFWGVLGALGLVLLIWVGQSTMQYPWAGWDTFGLWVSAFLTIAVLSFLYGDNPVYKFAEALFIGVSAAYAMVQGVWESIFKSMLAKLWPELAANFVEYAPATPAWNDLAPDLGSTVVTFPDTGTQIYYAIPLILGVLLLWRLAPKGGWIARWPLALIVGWSAGTNLVRFLVSDFAEQIDATLIPLVVVEGGALEVMQSFSNIVLVLGCLAALIYFFFSVEHKGAFGYASRFGIWVLMVTFGFAFGFTVMGRIALLVGLMEFLFVNWLHIIPQ